MLLIHFWAYSILSSSVTFILIMILRRFCEMNLKVIIPYKIWLFTLISVVIPLIPFEFFSNISFWEHAKKNNYTNNNVIYNDVLSDTVSKTSDLAINVNKINSSALIIILVCIWSLGIVFMFFRYLIGIKQIRDIENESRKMLRLEHILSRCIIDSNVLNTKVRIGYSSKVDDPMVFWKSGYSIILPQKLLRNLSDKELKLVILHELNHIKSKDLFVNYLYSLFLIFCWWNPILFVAKKIMEKDCEICCDNNVLKLLEKEEYKLYGEVIIKCCTFHKVFRNNKFVQYFVGANYDLKKRIYNISEYKRHTKSKFHWFALIIMCLSSIIQTPFVSAHTTSSKYKADIDYTSSSSIEQNFKNHKGNFVLLNGKNQKYTLYNESESRERYAPDSTFKIYLALFGFEQDVISQNNTEQKWDGKKYPFKEWNRDQDLKSSMSNSVNWYYENINKALAKDKVKNDLKKLNYGNQDISGKNSYWNESTLKISSLEQVQLLKKLDNNSFNYTEGSIKAVKKSLLIQQTDNYQLFGKTGTGIINHKEKSGWFIGFVKTKGNTYYFATHLKDSDNANGKTAKNISEDILKEMGLIY